MKLLFATNSFQKYTKCHFLCDYQMHLNDSLVTCNYFRRMTNLDEISKVGQYLKYQTYQSK